ncbi:hypothetical protein N9D52_03030 [Flavobacteriaceae bacterium]|nr:hypothetical protein [Flavobacteriaceae bacterium]
MEYLDSYKYYTEDIDKLNLLSENDLEVLAAEIPNKSNRAPKKLYGLDKAKAEAFQIFLTFQGEIEEYVINKIKDSNYPLFEGIDLDEPPEGFWNKWYYNTYNGIQERKIDDEIYQIEKHLILTLKQINKNPSVLLIEQKVKVLEELFKGNNKALEASIEFILQHMNNEFLLNIGHTDAWASLSKYRNDLLIKPESVKRRKKEAKTPKWLNGNYQKLHFLLSQLHIFKKEYSLEEFINTFSGKPISKVKEIQFESNIEGSTKVLFLETLIRKEMISISNQEVLSKLIGKNINFYKNTKSRLNNVKNISNGDMLVTAIYTALTTAV